MQKKVIRYLVLCFFIFINNVLLCTEKTSNKNSRIKINISTSFQCDIGLLLGYMLEVYNLNNNMINQRTFNRLLKLKKEVNSEKRTKLENHNKLLKILDERPYLERLLQVPILFDSFSNTKTAYDLILGIEKINKQNRGIYNILNNTIFLVSPQLQRLTGSDKEAARLLIEGITEEYKNLKNKPYFFQEFADNKEIEDYEEELENKFLKAIKAVDFNNSFENIYIQLVPIVPESNYLFDAVKPVNRITTLLPSSPEEKGISLWNVYYEVCRNIVISNFGSEISSNESRVPGLNKAKSYNMLLRHSILQLMFEGMRGTKTYEEFFKTSYGDLSELAKEKILEQSIELTGRKCTENEIRDLKKSLKKQRTKASKLLFNKGYLVTESYLRKIRERTKGKNYFRVNTEGAIAMYRALVAIYKKKPLNKVKKLINKAFECEAYKLVNKDYTTKYKIKSTRVSLEKFRKFLLGLCDNEILLMGNSSLQSITVNYVNFMSKPSAYFSAIEDYNSFKDSFYFKAFDKVKAWLPSDIKPKVINIWILFNMKPFIQTFNNNIYVNVLSFLNDSCEVNKEYYFKSLCYALYNLLYNTRDTFKKKAKFSELPDSSKTKMLLYFLDNIAKTGMAVQIGFNLPGLISEKLDKNNETYWINQEVKKKWMSMQNNSMDIFKEAKMFLSSIKNGDYKNYNELYIDFRKKWMNKQNSYDDTVDVGALYYIGTEIMGTIYDVYGKDGIIEVENNLFKLIPMFNKALLKNKPKNYKKYLFPDSIVDYLKEEQRAIEKVSTEKDIQGSNTQKSISIGIL